MNAALRFPEYAQEVAALQAKYSGASQGGIAFYGSSSIRLWPGLNREFPGELIYNLGFGGSTLAACAAFFSDLVAPLNPRSIVFFAGDNDLAMGSEPQQVWQSLVDLLAQRALLPQPVPFAFIELKPSPARARLFPQIQEANEWCRRELWAHENTYWVGIYEAMLDQSGEPRHELFAADGVHLSRAGYQVWLDHLKREAPAVLAPTPA